MAYAKYLSPAFHAWCNDVVRKVMQGEGGGFERRAIAEVLDELRAMAARLKKTEDNQAALWSHISFGGYIPSARLEALTEELYTLADVEVRVGMWMAARSRAEPLLRTSVAR